MPSISTVKNEGEQCYFSWAVCVGSLRLFIVGVSVSIHAWFSSRSGSNPYCSIQQHAVSQQEYNTPHRKAQGSLRILVKRHLEGCPNKNYCSLLLSSRQPRTGILVSVQHSQNGLPFLKATSSLSLHLRFEESRSMHKGVIVVPVPAIATRARRLAMASPLSNLATHW